MTGKIFRSCFLVGLAMMVLCTALFLVVMTNKHEQTVYAEMRQEMRYVRHGLEQSGKEYLTTLTGTQERLTWVAKDGTVLYDSVADPATMENHADRAEIRQAEQEGSGQSKHLSDTLLQKTLYYAVRLDDGTVLRLASVQTTMGVILLGVLQPVLVILILAIVISVLMASRLARQITKPINSIDLEDPRADETDQELFPLVSRLREQNRTIHQQMEALQRRQREFTALAENMNEGVLLLDGQYHILSSNQGAMALLGQEEKPEDLQEDCRREIRVAAGRALAGHHAQSLMDLGEQVIEILANPVIANGQVTGAVILMVDVTEREQRESLRREFSANVSHELKTPLTSISGFAELMKEGLVDPETMQEFAGDIYKECQQLIALVEDIMKLSRLDEGSEDLEQEDVDLYGLARKVLSDLRPIADQRGIALHIEGKGQKIHGVCGSSTRWSTISARTPSNTTKTKAPSPSSSPATRSKPCCPCRTPASASPRPSRSAFSSASIGWTRATPARSGAPAWACPSSSTGHSSTTPESPWTVSRAWAPPSPFTSQRRHRIYEHESEHKTGHV